MIPYLPVTQQERASCAGCPKGIEMCQRRPCWGTPADITRLIDAGHGPKLMLDHWVNTDRDDTFIVGPAIVEHEGSVAPWSPFGRCTFLTEDNQCGVHAMQPTEGALSCCKLGEMDLHKRVAMTWDTEEGRAVVERWKALVNF